MRRSSSVRTTCTSSTSGVRCSPTGSSCPGWSGYAAYTERFADNLKGVEDKIPYLRELGVTYLHLMPLLEPRAGTTTAGMRSRDYRAVRVRPRDGRRPPRPGDHAARERDEPRARPGPQPRRRASTTGRSGRGRGRSTTRTTSTSTPTGPQPDAYERTLPEVFPDFAPGNFSWDEELQQWVWTTFNAWQWDLDWSNPDVLVEFAEIILFLANLGVEVLRLDAIAFLWKRMGTTCQNEPEVHAVTQVLKTVARIACPALAFKAEAIVAPHDLVQYLGAGRHHGKVSDLAYHNTLMVQIWSMLATADTRLAAHTLERLPRAPSSAAWITYVRCHDDIGWAITDEDTSGVGLSGYHHRRFLSDWYSGLFPGSTAHGLVFQENPATGDRRISGTTAALTGLSAAGRPDEIDDALGRFFLTHAIVYALGRHPGRLERRRARHGQRPGLGRRAGPRDRQPVGPPAAAGLASRRAATRPAHGGGPRVQRAGAPRQRPVVPPAPARQRAERGAAGRGRRRPRDRSPRADRRHGLPLQHHPRDAAVPGLADPGARSAGALGRHLGAGGRAGADGSFWLTPYAAWWLVERPDAG